MKRKYAVLLPVNVNAELAGVILFLKNLCGKKKLSIPDLSCYR